MFGAFLRFIKRPLIDEQTTARDAYQQYQGYSKTDIKGNGGQAVLGTVNATNPANIAVGPTFKLNDPSVTGVNNYTLGTQPLTSDDPTVNVIQSAQL